MLTLTTEEREIADGRHGTARGMAMRIVADISRIMGADRLVPVSSAHIDGALYHGDSGVHFGERLVQGEGRVAVPTTLNVGALDLLHPHRVRVDPARRAMALRLMQAYETLGCQPTWTCAPYQVGHRPSVGTDVAWGESNAVVFVNSVLGARTNRYGDFLDICCALVGRAPYYGLHVPTQRGARIVVRLHAMPPALTASDAFYPVLGTWLGMEFGHTIVAFEGLPPSVSEDQLKALGAAAASTGAVGLFHVVGVTPEAPTREAACGGVPPDQVIELTAERLWSARDRLTTSSGDAIDAVAVGSPHFSLDEFSALEALLDGRRLSLPFYVCTARQHLRVLDAAGRLAPLERAGVTVVADTCVVVTPILPATGSVLMTNSGKFAHYGPANTGYDTVFGTLSDCVESAISGRVVRDESMWRSAP
ncbi:MAG: aconitase X catalytic domain-containing protein [Gemmatimonadaceae bacterium]